jgi:choline kinase
MSGRLEVVVLAAGKGSRLGGLGEDRPKWLLEVGDETIADLQLTGIELARESSGGALGPVRVVTGHADAAIRRYLDARRGNGVGVLHNEDYARLNNWFSVLLALRALDESCDRIAIINGDLFARPEWIGAFVADAAETDSESLIAVDLERRLTDESMKVAGREDDPGLLEAIGKVGVTGAAGEYVGMLMARGSVLAAFREVLESFVGDRDRGDEWYERAVGVTAAEGADWRIWPTPDGEWVEIDDEGDLAMALQLGGRG